MTFLEPNDHKIGVSVLTLKTHTVVESDHVVFTVQSYFITV